MKKSAEANDDVTSGTRSAFYTISGFINSILHGEESNPKPLFYLACPSCKKKVTDDYNSYKCERCDKSYHSAVPTYNFAVRISDFTDS
jgi:hypothetical protein